MTSETTAGETWPEPRPIGEAKPWMFRILVYVGSNMWTAAEWDPDKPADYDPEVDPAPRPFWRVEMVRSKDAARMFCNLMTHFVPMPPTPRTQLVPMPPVPR